MPKEIRFSMASLFHLSIRSQGEINLIFLRDCKNWEITHLIILFFADCHEVHQAGGMRYEGDYYIKIKPEKATKPFKVLCKVVNGTGERPFNIL